MKRGIKVWARLIGPLLAAATFAGCATTGGPPPPPEPVSLEQGVAWMTRDLIRRIAGDAGSEFGMVRLDVAVEPFVEEISRQVPRAGRRVARLIVDQADREARPVRLAPLSTKNLARVDYLITGTIKAASGAGTEPRYRLRAELRNLKKVRTVGASEVRVSGTPLDLTPIPAHRDNPFFAHLRPTAPGGAGGKTGSLAPASGDKEVGLTTRALLAEAEQTYGDGEYKEALELFQQAKVHGDGDGFRTWAGIYMANQKLGREAAAEEAFGRLVAISVEQYDALTVKFLFDVNSADFRKDGELQAKYDLWLRQIGRYFREAGRCLRIVGHSSRTGAEGWNRALSLHRAINIRNMLKAAYPNIEKRSRAVGKGYAENIVGIGTDDERDALDRRVEIIPVDCGKL